VRIGPRLLAVLAMVFAVAVGVALGAGPLSQAQQPAASDRAPSTPPSVEDVRAAYADTFAAAVASRVYAGGLTGRGVALVTWPGADPATTEALSAEIAAAGGSVVSSFALSERLVDPGEKSLVDTLGSQLVQQLTTAKVPAETSAYDRLGALLGKAVATPKAGGAPVQADGATILESLQGAELVTPTTPSETRASLVLVVLGAATAEDADPIVEGLATGLAATSGGLVVAGGAALATDGVLARLRASTTASGLTSVDGIEGPAGRATAVLTLVRAAAGGSGGAFGASGADGAVPLG
jgi:Copper transport outer membrane protein, MctB